MYISGCPCGDFGTVRDSLLQAIWLRREQVRVFETVIGVMAAGMSIDPGISKRIEDLTDDYTELVLPGSEKARKASDQAFVEKTNRTLTDVAKLLAQYSADGKGRVKPL